MEQLHKKFANSQVKALITRYLKKEIGRKYIQEILGIKKTRFFALAKQLKEDPENFSISYSRKVPTRKISKDLLEQKYGQKVSLPTIIDRAKKNNFYFSKLERKAHEHEVLTNYPGELIQHDSSHHQFAPYAKGKWYLITSLDDFSPFYPLCYFSNQRDYLGTYSGLRICLE